MFGCCCAGGGGPGDPSDECSVCVEVNHPRPEWLLTLPATLIAQSPECPQNLGGSYVMDWGQLFDYGLDGMCQWNHIMVNRLSTVTYPPPLFNGVCGATDRDLTWLLVAGRIFYGEPLGTPQYGISVVALAEGSGTSIIDPDAVWRRVGLPLACDGTYYSVPFHNRSAVGLWAGYSTLPAVSVKVTN